MKKWDLRIVKLIKNFMQNNQNINIEENEVHEVKEEVLENITSPQFHLMSEFFNFINK